MLSRLSGLKSCHLLERRVLIRNCDIIQSENKKLAGGEGCVERRETKSTHTSLFYREN